MINIVKNLQPPIQYTYVQFLHPFILFYYQFRVKGGLGPISCFRVRDRIHPGLVASLSQALSQQLFETISNVASMNNRLIS